VIDAEASLTTPPAVRDARARPLWHYLALVVAFAVAPISIITTALLVGQANNERIAVGRGLQATAEAIARAVDSEVRSYQAVLHTLARSPMLLANDLASFHGYATGVGRDTGTFVIVYDRSGEQILNSMQPYGAALRQPLREGRPAQGDEPPLTDAAAIRRVLENGTPTTTSLFRSLTTGRLLIAVAVPVKRDGELQFVLAAAIDPKVLAPLVQHVGVDPHATRTAVIDSNDFVLARWSDAATVVGRRAGEDYRRLRRAAPQFLADVTSREGDRLLVAAHTSSLTGWTATAATARGELSRADNLWLIGAVLAAASALLGSFLAYRLSRSINASMMGLVAVSAGGAQPTENQEPAIQEISAVKRALLRSRELERQASADRETALVAQARRRELEQSARAKDHFIAVLSHELRNPLAAVSNAVALVRRGAADGPVVDMLERQVRHLIKLVDDLLDVTRLAQGKLRLELTPVDLRQLIPQAIQASAVRVERKRQQIDLAMPDEPVPVRADPVRLVQVISNLIDNASKYSPQHTVIVVRLRVTDRHAVLAVRDQGRGIAPEDVDRLFEPFTQLPVGDGVLSEGLGLGLPLARQLVEQHGGRIWLHSDGPERGCEAMVELPLDKQGA
jgi:signal transduction histidine kinase